MGGRMPDAIPKGEARGLGWRRRIAAGKEQGVSRRVEIGTRCAWTVLSTDHFSIRRLERSPAGWALLDIGQASRANALAADELRAHHAHGVLEAVVIFVVPTDGAWVVQLRKWRLRLPRRRARGGPSTIVRGGGVGEGLARLLVPSLFPVRLLALAAAVEYPAAPGTPRERIDLPLRLTVGADQASFNFKPALLPPRFTFTRRPAIPACSAGRLICHCVQLLSAGVFVPVCCAM
jgi:hypothetical protein